MVRHFRRYLLNRCQNEFQREKDYEKEYDAKKIVIENNKEVTLTAILGLDFHFDPLAGNGRKRGDCTVALKFDDKQIIYLF